MDKLLNKIFEENFVEINNFSIERLDYIKNASFECDFDCNENRKIKEIILYNSDDEYLAVRGVEVLNENKKINYPHEIIYGSIKSNRGFELNNVGKYFLVCTSRQPTKNWIKISFKTPVILNKVKVFLRKNRDCYRWSNTFCLDVVFGDGERKTVIENYSSVNQFIGKLQSKYKETPNYELISFFLKIFVDLKVKYYRNFTSNFERKCKELSLDAKVLIDFINKIVKEYNVQYTNAFGFIRTFSLWSDEEKYQYLSSCNELITLLRTFTPHVCYAYGTVLGFVRECSGFIPHDCDIDILVSLNQNQYSNISDFYEDLFPYFEDKGVKIEKSDNYHLHVKYKNTHRIDIFPKIMYPTIDIEVMGLDCPVPKNPFKFLDSVYGNNWRVPLDKSFRNVDDPNKQ